MTATSDPGSTGPVVVLVGAPGAGKTTVGQRLADHWNVSFLDTDAAIESRAGKSVADIFVTDGEEAFRELEQSAVVEALENEGGVVSLGGGAILNADSRRLLADVTVVWLQVSASDAARRVGMTGARPLLLGNVRGMLVTMMEERTPLYAQVATHTVMTDDRSVDDVVNDVITAIEPASKQ
ncbi:MAG: shikimate kinase [Candidatus Nanopelagicales bacterium]